MPDTSHPQPEEHLVNWFYVVRRDARAFLREIRNHVTRFRSELTGTELDERDTPTAPLRPIKAVKVQEPPVD